MDPVHRRQLPVPAGMSDEIVSNCTEFLDAPDRPRLLLENSLFFVSAGLSLQVASAVVKDPDDSIPSASGHVLMLCGCEVMLAALSLLQLAVSRIDCELADAWYGVISSLEMAAQLLALVAAAIIGTLIIEPFWPACCAAIRVPLRPRTQMFALAFLCSLPAFANLGICYGSRLSTGGAAACPTSCGYALNHVSVSEVLQSGNQCAGALLVLGTTIAAGARALPRSRRTHRARPAASRAWRTRTRRRSAAFCAFPPPPAPPSRAPSQRSRRGATARG